VTEGFEVTLDGKPREESSRELIFDGEQEAKMIALRDSSHCLFLASRTVCG